MTLQKDQSTDRAVWALLEGSDPEMFVIARASADFRRIYAVSDPFTEATMRNTLRRLGLTDDFAQATIQAARQHPISDPR